MDFSNMKKYKTVSMFVTTRKMTRNKLREQHGNKGLASAWHHYQKTEKGKPKTNVNEVG